MRIGYFLLAVIAFGTFYTSCKEPVKQFTLSDIKLPEPEGELAKHLGIMAVIEHGRRVYLQDAVLDTVLIEVYDENGSTICAKRSKDHDNTWLVIYVFEMENGLLKEWYHYSGNEMVNSHRMHQSYRYELDLNELKLIRTETLEDDPRYLVQNVMEFDDNGTVFKKVSFDMFLDDLNEMFIERYEYDEEQNALVHITRSSPELLKFNARLREKEGDAWEGDHSKVTYYYRDEQRILLDSIVTLHYNEVEGDLHNGNVKYFDEAGYPSTIKYEQTGYIHYYSTILYGTAEAINYVDYCDRLKKGDW